MKMSTRVARLAVTTMLLAPGAAAVGSIVQTPASAAAAPVAAIAPRPAVTATVPNYFYRDCSYITRRCTGYYQTNGSYNPTVPSYYYTRWVWRWI